MVYDPARNPTAGRTKPQPRARGGPRRVVAAAAGGCRRPAETGRAQGPPAMRRGAGGDGARL
jgi:hypothetical protein